MAKQNDGKDPKNANGEGSIGRTTDGRWWSRITLASGKRKAYYGKTRADVFKKLTSALRDQEKGLPIVPEKQTVGTFFTQWLEIARTEVRLSTYAAYETYVRRHIIPTLGHVRIARLTPQQVQALYAKKQAEGLSSTSVVQIHRIIHRALKQAMRWGLVAANVSEAVNPPRKRHVEFRTLSGEEARRLLDEAAGDHFEALYVLALTTGMREGELLALRWRDVDMDQARLQVMATMQRDRVNKGFMFSEPKTDKSRRQVMLTSTAIAALRRHYIAQLEGRLMAGPMWEDNGLVFPNSVGKPVEAGNMLRRSFWPLLAKAGLPHIRFHDLRHSAATLLMGQGIHPKVVSEMLGHSKISITLDLYSHVLPSMQQEATQAMDAIFATR